MSNAGTPRDVNDPDRGVLDKPRFDWKAKNVIILLRECRCYKWLQPVVERNKWLWVAGATWGHVNLKL